MKFAKKQVSITQSDDEIIFQQIFARQMNSEIKKGDIDFGVTLGAYGDAKTNDL